MVKYRIGIIGFGKIAQDQHVPAIRKVPEFELIAVSSTSGKTHPDATYFYTDYKEMLTQAPGLDAVAICTPPGPRRTIAADCLAAGKHVLLEKPPAGTVTEVRDIGTRATAAGRVAFATWHARHNEAVDRAKAALAGKTVRSLDVVWKEDVRRWHPGQDWVFQAGGFGIFDPGINALSIVTAILPAPIFVTAAELAFPTGRDAPIAADLTFSTGGPEDGSLKAAFDWRQTGEQTWRIDVTTTDGVSLSLTDGGRCLQIVGQPTFEGPAEEYANIYRHFARLLATGTSDVDASPFQLVADSFMLGRRREVEAFDFASPAG